MTKRFWLSFIDSFRAEGERFLGVCIVDVSEADAAKALLEVAVRFPNARPGAEWIAAATRKAWALGINPGGEVMSIDISELEPPEGVTLPLNRLLRRDELARLGLA